ncbi:hypothetical protein [Pseudomonas sp. efr-133-TYG-5]|uniref:hypothetical protein n=1 Tax=Pseudomonas sp. efr-133-TYG-5 TaxID=3040310 RepID=UPI0025563F9E|nr:hypothetical protein [Pseudomonas sp. efr-133-TYG-5]
MNLLSRLLSMISAGPSEQIAGYSKRELQALFNAPLSLADLTNQVNLMPLIDSGIAACHATFLMDPEDAARLASLVASRFRATHQRTFNGQPVVEYHHRLNAERLVLFGSSQEFNGVTMRLVTNSTDFLNLLSQETFAVPPPWIAFNDYPPSWWSDNMQGAQGHYNDCYFVPFFTRLSDVEKRAYCARFAASPAWIERLEWLYGVIASAE